MFINVHVVPVFPFFPLKALFTLQAASTDTFSMLTHIRGFLGFGFLPTVTSAYRSRSWGLTHQSSENYATHSKSWAPMNRISVHGGQISCEKFATSEECKGPPKRRDKPHRNSETTEDLYMVKRVWCNNKVIQKKSSLVEKNLLCCNLID